MTVYADILLLVNISMDILSLFIVGCILHKRMNPRRIFASSLVGGVFATVDTLFININGMIGRIISIAIGMITSAIMICIVFSKPTNVVSLIRHSIMLWGAGALIGGVMSVILSIGEPIMINRADSFIPTFVGVAVITLSVVRLFRARSTRENEEIKITVGDVTYTVTGLCDSGSFAVEPISGLPVIIVKSSVLSGVNRELHSPDCRFKIRLIPTNSVSGSRLLYGFVPDNIFIGGNEVAAVVAIDDSGGTFSDNMAIIPAALCKRL